MKSPSLRILLYLVAFAVLAAASPLVRADQPNMENALDHLNKAKAALERANAANPIHGGHADAALHRVNQAIDEVNAGIQYYRNHR